MRDRGVYICQIRIIILFMMPVHMEHNRSRISTIFHDLEQEQEEGIHSNGVFYYWIPTVHSLYTPTLYILNSLCPPLYISNIFCTYSQHIFLAKMRTLFGSKLFLDFLAKMCCTFCTHIGHYKYKSE